MTSQIRILDYDNREGQDLYQVEYPNGRGIRWVHAFMIGGQYTDEKNAVKFRHEQKLELERRNKQLSGALAVNQDQPSLDIEASGIPTEARRVNDKADGVVESLKCICQQVYAASSDEVITCSMCARRSHIKCVRAEGIRDSELLTWQCPFCRLLYMDPFSPGLEIVAYTITPRNMNLPSSVDGTLSMRFNIDPTQLKDWQSKRIGLSVRSIAISHKSLRLAQGPLWPKEATASVNSFRDVFKILPAKYGHVRREPLAKSIDDLIRPNSNSVNVHYHAPVENVGANQAPRFLFAVIAAENRGKTQLMSELRRPGVSESKDKAVSILRILQFRAAQMQSAELQVDQSTWDGDIMRSRCPISLCEIEVPVRGSDCEHLQTFDAEAFIDVNMRVRNVEKRWRCPVCSKLAKPETLEVDAFVAEGINQARIEEPAALTVRLQLKAGPAPHWEILPEELAQGEGSDDEEDDHPKRARVSADQASAENEVVLDLE